MKLSIPDIMPEIGHHDMPIGTCLLAYRGSIAHAMYVPGSDPNSIDDIDLMGIVIGEGKVFPAEREEIFNRRVYSHGR